MLNRTQITLKGTPPGGRPLALAVLAVFAVAMAYMEAAIVVYLRELYYPDGFSFPLAIVGRDILLVEIGREVSTIVFLLAVSWFAGRRLAERFAMFCFAFAIWDIFYYVWLKVMLGWPDKPVYLGCAVSNSPAMDRSGALAVACPRWL